MFPVTEHLLETWDALSITAGRLTGGAVVLVSVFLLTGGWGRILTGVPWRKILVLGGVGVGGSTFLLAIGIGHSGAVVSALLATTAPIIAALLARVVYREPLRRGIVTGVGLAVSGGVCAVLAGGEGVEGLRGGELFILTALCLWTWYSLTAQRWLQGLPQLGIAALTVASGALIVVLTVALLSLAQLVEVRFETSGRSLGLIAYLALGPASLALFLWHFGVSRVGITVASMYGNLAPVVVVCIAIWFGRYPTLLHLAGGCLIISGVVYVQLRARATGRRGSA